MKMNLIVFFSILLVGACSVNDSSIKNNVVLQPSKYHLENGNTVELKLNYSVVKSLKSINLTNELMVDTGAGTEFLDSAGKYISVYNQQPNDSMGPVSELLASRIVGDNIILCYFDHIAVLDLQANQEIKRLEKPSNEAGTKIASISPNGRYAFAFGRLWDLATNQQLKFYQSDELFHTAGNGADFSPDNNYLVISADLLTEGRAQLWDLRDGKLKRTWKHTGLKHAMFGPDGNTIFFIVEKQVDSMWKGYMEILAYSMQTGSKVGDLTFSSPMSVLPITVDGEYIVTGHKNGDIHVWSYRTFTAMQNFNANAAATAMVKDADGRVWCGFSDGKLVVIENGQFSQVRAFKSSIRQLAVLKNKLVVEVFTQKDGMLQLFDIATTGL